MLVEYVGHACFRIHLSSGRELLVDPYQPGGLGGRLRLEAIPLSPDLVFLTHDHADHADLSWLKGKPRLLRGEWCEDDLRIEVMRCQHDEHGGRLRGGEIRMMSLHADGMHLVHCGDLGQRLLPGQISSWGTVDVLIVPVGGYYTLGPEAAAELVRLVNPRWAVPCHYRSSTVDLEELSGLEDFVRRFRGGRWPGAAVAMTALDPGQTPSVRPTVVELRAQGCRG
jgi:L-ascorbate metabolism protein UlaG (beta-lactamase superfamily)